MIKTNKKNKLRLLNVFYILMLLSFILLNIYTLSINIKKKNNEEEVINISQKNRNFALDYWETIFINTNNLMIINNIDNDLKVSFKEEYIGYYQVKENIIKEINNDKIKYTSAIEEKNIFFGYQINKKLNNLLTFNFVNGKMFDLNQDYSKNDIIPIVITESNDYKVGSNIDLITNDSIKMKGKVVGIIKKDFLLPLLTDEINDSCQVIFRKDSSICMLYPEILDINTDSSEYCFLFNVKENITRVFMERKNIQTKYKEVVVSQKAFVNLPFIDNQYFKDKENVKNNIIIFILSSIIMFSCFTYFILENRKEIRRIEIWEEIK